MNNHQFMSRIDAAKQRAQGRWTEILAALGVDQKVLTRRNQPCPLCGGTDRFQYTDKFGEGNYHCRHCGAGGGFKLLQASLGIDFSDALRRVETFVGSNPPMRPTMSGEPAAERMKKLAKRLWDEAVPVASGDEVDRYLSGRGLHFKQYPAVLRLHPALGYFEKDLQGKSQKRAEFAAMLACIQAPDGEAVTLHRTYLADGRKADVMDAKKVLSSGINGAAVRLFDATDELAIAEGIETALAVHLATGKPVWAGLSAGNVERLVLPEAVRTVHIYADNDADANYTGQAAAYALALRLKAEENKNRPRQVAVFAPKCAGLDWADVWLAHTRKDTSAA